MQCNEENAQHLRDTEERSLVTEGVDLRDTANLSLDCAAQGHHCIDHGQAYHCPNLRRSNNHQINTLVRTMRLSPGALLSALLLFTVAFASAQQVPVTPPAIPTIESCGFPDTDLFRLDSITLSPDPPVRGENLRVVVKGQVKEDVGDGSVDVKVKLGQYITILNKRYSLCEVAGEFSETCPIGNGQREWVKDIALPSVIPPGRFKADVTISTADGRSIACFIANFVF